MDLNRVPSRSTTGRRRVLIVESHITQGIETNNSGIDKGSANRVINEVIIRRIFINATADRAIDTWVRGIMPDLSCLKSTKIDLIFARRAVVTCYSRRLLKNAAESIIKEK